MAEIRDLSTTDASNNGTAADAGFAENMNYSAVNNAARALEGLIARWFADTNGTLTTTGSSNAYSLAANRTVSAYADGDVYLFEANHSNTGASTLDVDTVGTASIVLPNGSALVGGEIVSGGRYIVSYDGTNFQLIGSAGALANLGLTDPGADRIVFWDDGSGVINWLEVSTGLTLSGTTLVTDDANIDHDALTNFVADEHVAHGSVTMTAGTGLTGGGTIAATRTFNLDISGLTAMTLAPDGADSFLYNDGGTMKQMAFEQVALPSNNVSTGRNFADGDVGHIVYWTGTSGTLTLVSGVGQDDCWIVLVNSGSGALTVGVSGVTLNSANSLTDIPAGGMGTLIRESSTVWFLGGNLQ